MLKPYYFTGQNTFGFFYFYYGKIQGKDETALVIDGINWDKINGYREGELYVPARRPEDNKDQYDVSKKDAQQGVIRLILGRN